MTAYHNDQKEKNDEAIVNYNVTQNSEYPDSTISFDGSWMTKGHRSHRRAGFVVESETGFVIDLEALFNLCTEREMKKKILPCV